ncbi:uncharacterized protein BJX67DRAFT_378951 [Aspergillus lucknowensis]|uniref:Uncharacterized protein n=1 Tax=Aspergillus lucknowensis TaxID=176173 RepID=A0ABR4M2N1_9EURO
MASSSKSRPNSRPTADRRYSARYLILVYRDTGPHFDPLEIQRLVAREQGKCTIVRQAGCTYFAFVDFAGKRFQTRNLGLFDVQGYHPKWIHVSSSPWRTLDEMMAMAQGHVLWNGIARPQMKKASPAGRKRTRTSASRAQGQSQAQAPASASASSSAWDLVGSATDESSLQELLQREMELDSEHLQSKPQNNGCVPLASGETEMARNVQYWQDGYRAGYKAAMSMSNTSLSTIDPPPSGAEVSQLFVPTDCADSDSTESTGCGLSYAFPSEDSNILGEVSQLDWNLELEDVWNPQLAA